MRRNSPPAPPSRSILRLWLLRDAGTGVFSAFQTVSGTYASASLVWTRAQVDLAAFAGETVRIAFSHTAADSGSVGGSDVSSGWYVDDVEIVKKVPAFTGDFEGGLDDWSADRGLWEVGTPASGPGAR